MAKKKGKKKDTMTRDEFFKKNPDRKNLMLKKGKKKPTKKASGRGR